MFGPRRVDAVGVGVSGAGSGTDARGARARRLDRASVYPGRANAALAVAAEHGFGAVLKAASFHQGWLLAEHGEGEVALAPMRDWVTLCRNIRAAMLIPAYLAWLAEVFHKLGRADEGLDLVRDALAAETASGYLYWDAELRRLKGMLLLQAGRQETSAESCFLEALEIARRQRAKLFELRAATSLSRLWTTQGRGAEARALLSDVYGWFTEGFDTPDLVEAKALLEELDRLGSNVGIRSPLQSSRLGKET